MFLSSRKRTWVDAKRIREKKGKYYGGDMKIIQRIIGLFIDKEEVPKEKNYLYRLASIPGKNQGTIDKPNYFFLFHWEKKEDLERLIKITDCTKIVLHVDFETQKVDMIEIDVVFDPVGYERQKSKDLKKTGENDDI